MNKTVVIQFFLPLISAFNICFSSFDVKRMKLFSILMALLHLGVSTRLVQILWMKGDLTALGLYNFSNYFGFNFTFSVNGANLFFIILNDLFLLFTIFFSWDFKTRNTKLFFSLIFVLFWSVNGGILANDLLTFFFFQLLSSLGLFLLLNNFSDQKRSRLGMEYLFLMLISSFFIFCPMVYLGSISFSKNNSFVFTIEEIKNLNLVFNTFSSPQSLCFWSITLGLFIRCSLFPFHAPLTRVILNMPLALSTAFFGVIFNLGIFGLLKYSLALFPEVVKANKEIIMFFGLFNILWGGILSTNQKHIFKILSYSTLCYIGLIVSGIFSSTVFSISGVFLKMLIFALTFFGIFLLVKIFEDPMKFSKNTFLKNWFKFIFLVLVLNFIGVPGLIGFNADFFIISGILKENFILGNLAAVGLLLLPLSFYKFYREFHSTFLENQEKNEIIVKETDLNKDMVSIINIAFLFLIFFIIMVYSMFPEKILETFKKIVESIPI